MAEVTYDYVQAWLDSYLEAWRSNDRERIEKLFTADARYAYAPWGRPVTGAERIADDWLRDPDEPGTWEADYRPITVAGNVAVASGETRYADGGTFANVFVMRFEDGRCAEFTEWFMEHPPTGEDE